MPNSSETFNGELKMLESTSLKERPTLAQGVKQWLVPAAILLMAGGIVSLIAGNWNTWASERVAQETDDAYLRADLTPLSPKVAGLLLQWLFPIIRP